MELDQLDILPTLDMQELGLELARARKRKGLTQEQAAKVIEVARTTLVAIEKGERRIKAGELIKLARHYGRQISDFVKPRPALPDMVSSVQFRGPHQRTEFDEEKIAPFVEEFADWCRQYLELEELLGNPLSPRYPSEFPLPRLHLAKAAEALAIEERNRLGLGDGPIPMIRDVLEQDVGLRVFFIPMPAQFSEMYFYGDAFGACMAINRNHREVRRRWSMAHAFAHFLTNRYAAILPDSQGNQFRNEGESERFADAFALYFLLPTNSIVRRLDEVRRQPDGLTVAELFRLADRYGVAMETLIRRMEDLRELPAGYWEQFRKRVKIQDAENQLGLGNIPGRDHKLPTRFRILAYEAYNAGKISDTSLARYLDADRIEARDVGLNGFGSDSAPGDAAN